MSTRLLTSVAAAAALTFGAATGAFAQGYNAPAGISTAATIGASASPLIGQGYLPTTRSVDANRDVLSTGSVAHGHRLGARHSR